MSKRLLSVLAFAFIVSAAASLLLYKAISSRMKREEKGPMTQVMVATRNLPVGTLISDLDVKVGSWPGPLPPQAITKKEDVVGRGVIANVYEGEPILDSRLAPKGAGAGLAATIPPGMRAVAVRVNEVVGVAGFAVPGMRVDVLVMGQPPGGGAGAGTITRTLLQNIEVLSAGQNIQKDAEGKPVTVQVVNLLVTPEQAEILSLASNDMRIQLVLRNPLDTKEIQTPGTTAAALLGRVAPPAPESRPKSTPVKAQHVVKKEAPAPVVAQRKAPVPIIVEVITGSQRRETKFQQQEESQNP
jgi:pilus assembly protein CpaB